MIERRTLLLCALPATLLTHPALAQSKRPLLAILSWAARDAPVTALVYAPFNAALAKLGWEAGRNIDIAERYADHDESRLPALAAELVALKPTVLFTNTSYAATVAANATRDIPVVVGLASETTLTELAGGNIARPAANVTGFALGAAEIDDKVITLVMEAVPAAQRIGLLINPRNPFRKRYPGALKGSLSVTGKTLVRLETAGLTDIEVALAKAAAERVDALFVADDAQIAARPEVRQRILAFAATAGIPVASSHVPFAREGALIVMGPSIPALAAAAAGYVDRILKGAKPSELPVQLPTVFTIVVNQKAAKALRISVPPTILIRADEVIE